ncbi:hypothetical protein D9615_006617 [Tricholomella constricta]|uniref:Phosphodeoxyriboaldolase n=1 Tax=Tricholomella constricta TaxID=117010 RepID=A0A8H5HA90_9AGAR|nr:hypothetical protein D9615_006617 [Tricholomella constricta]
MTHRPPSSTAFIVTSTTHLRPRGLGALPLSPPIHREQERRRLRKKSRPQGPGIELSTMRRERDSDGYDYGYDTGGEEGEVDGRPQTPPPPPVQPAQSVLVTPSGNGNAGGRGSTTPGEVVGSRKLDTLPHPRHLLDDNNLTLLLRLFQRSPSVSPTTWNNQQANVLAPCSWDWDWGHVVLPRCIELVCSAGEHERHQPFHASASAYAPTEDKQRDEQQQTQTPFPAKLVKRKSLGFVQLRRGLEVGGHGDNAAEKNRERERERYADLGLGRGGGGEKEQDVFVADTGREPERDMSGGRRSVDKDKEKDGSRSSSADGDPPGSQLPSLICTLFPPIELQPLSPPRLCPTPQRPQTGGAKGIPPERMLSPTLSSSTVGSTASAPPVCVNGAYVSQVAKRLSGSSSIAHCVIGFSFGAGTTKAKAIEARQAIEDGAKEIDMVISALVHEDIRSVVDASAGNAVKVILETVLLSDEEKIAASFIAVEAGAAFVKTCIGFLGGGASAADVALMKKMVQYKGNVKVKASAGIRSLNTCLEMLEAGADRIGTSSGVAIKEIDTCNAYRTTVGGGS